jgi:hypothetical protein
VPHQLLEDLATGGERLGRSFRGFELGSLCCDRAPRRRDLRRFVGVERRGRSPAFLSGATIRPATTAVAAVFSTRAAINRTFRTRGAVAWDEWSVVTWAILPRSIVPAGCAIVPAGSAIAIASGTTILPRPSILTRRRR